MDKLPTELFDQVLDSVGYPEVTPAIWKTFGQPNARLKALRLCSKDLAERVAPRLFQIVLVFITARSFAKLRAIAVHPEHRYLVKEVRVFPRHLAQGFEFKDKSAYQHHIMDVADNELDNDTEDENHDVHHLTNKQIEDGYANYLKLRREQSRLLPRVQTLLEEAFRQFSNLRTVIASQYSPFTDSLGRFKDQLPTSLFRFHRRTFLTLSGDRWAQNEYPYAFDRENAAETAVVVRALSLSNVDVQNLVLCNSYRALDLGLLQVLRSHSQATKSMFAKLQKLTFPMPGWRFGEDEYSRIAVACTATWIRLLKSASNLETLELVGCRAASWQCDPEIESIYADAYFPRLRRLALRSLPITRTAFSAFVLRHASRLKELSLNWVMLEEGSWQGIFTDIRRRDLNVRLHLLLCTRQNRDYFNYDGPFSDNFKLQVFIQGDQDWPSDLPKGLSREASIALHD